jgi:hypothetical protein
LVVAPEDLDSPRAAVFDFPPEDLDVAPDPREPADDDDFDAAMTCLLLCRTLGASVSKRGS